MRVLIAGATGFIGSALRAAFEVDDHEVIAIGRDARSAGPFIDVESHHLELAGLDLSSVDVVYQLTGAPITPRRWGATAREELRASRIVPTDIVARAIASLDGPRPALVVGNAIGYYGERGETVLEESAASGDGFLPDLCRAWEAAAAPARAAGARVVTARTGIVLGNGGALAPLLGLFRLGLGARLGSGAQWTSWISREDEVRALRFLGEHTDLEGTFNLVSPTPVRNIEFTHALARAVGRPARLALPRALIVAAVGARTTDEFVLASQRVAPARLLSVGFCFSHPALAEALELVIRSGQ